MTQPASKLAFITGANKGIGFEIARQLGLAGYKILVGARDPENGRQAVDKLGALGVDAQPLAIDMLDPESIAAAGKQIEAGFGQLDILVNNAGIANQQDGAPSAADLDAITLTMRTNFLGAVATTQAVLPLLRKAPAARIVNVSSGLGSITQNANPDWEYAWAKFIGYNASKAALNMFTVQLAWELRDTAIKVNAADPGYTATDLNGNRGTQTVEQGAAEAVRLALLPADGPTGTFSNTEGLVPW